MDEMQQITLDQWMSWKEDIREKLRETAGNFVYIGFRLKQIRDSGMFDGAADIFEFAMKEYGLSKSTTSRFIAINEKFSEGGNSLELRQEYRAIGSSKLAEMLTLPDAECQMITERTTVKEIRELKNFGKQEVPEAAGEEEEQLTPLEKCLVDYFKDKKDMLNAVMKDVYDDRYKEAAEQMNPSGYATHKKGICFMFMYDFNAGVKLKLLTEPQPVSMTWTELLLEVYDIFANIFEAGEEDVHKAYYGEPEKEVEKDAKIETQKAEETQKNQGVEGSVATSQQEPETEEKDAQIVENVEEAESQEEESGENTQQSDSDEVRSESEDNENGTDESGTGPSGALETNDEGHRETGEEEAGEERQHGCDDICIDRDTDAEEEEPGSAEPYVNMDYILTAEKIEKDVREKAKWIFEDMEDASTSDEWRNIKHRLNNLNSDIESILRYLDMAEEGDEADE